MRYYESELAIILLVLCWDLLFFRSVLIPRNSSIPASNSHMFYTVEDNQITVDFPVYTPWIVFLCVFSVFYIIFNLIKYGYSYIFRCGFERASKNCLLGKFVLSGVRPARRGATPLLVKFDVDAMV